MTQHVTAQAGYADERVSLNIGEAAATSGVSAKMIRHYERIGLIQRARRTASNYRQYSSADVHSLKFIRRARSLGFSLPEIKALLALWRNRNRPSAEVKKLALTHIDDIEKRIREMHAMRDTLADLARRCRGNQRPECPILADLEGSLPSAEGRRKGDGGS